MKHLIAQYSPSYAGDFSYLTLMGSRAYGTHSEKSDYDFYGFVVPPAEVVFPHLAGVISGFDEVQKFEQLQIQHAPSPMLGEVDVTIYNIVKYFKLVMDGNPNMVDSLFSPPACVQYADEVGMMVKRARKIFLSQKMYHTFRGMLHAHLSRLKSGHTKEGRKENEENFGYDTKDAYHCYRMLLEINEVLFEGWLTLDRHSDFLLSIREGKYSKETILDWLERGLENTEERVEKHPEEIVIPYSPDKEAIKTLLLECLEQKYGSLSKLGVKR